MSAAASQEERGTSAAQPIAALRTEVFDTLAAARGATSNIQRARLIGVDRGTIRRMRNREFAPRLEIALRMAERLGTTVDELFERVAA